MVDAVGKLPMLAELNSARPWVIQTAAPQSVRRWNVIKDAG
jgi:hypothetical protein